MRRKRGYRSCDSDKTKTKAWEHKMFDRRKIILKTEVE